jgi:chromosome segregation ATPase
MLSALRQVLDNLHVADCRLAHERVILDQGTAVRRHANGVESSLVRVGLCDWNTRAQQLACAHTTARHRLIDVIQTSAALNVLDQTEARRLEERVTQLATVIHEADWAKGELEAAYARAAESGAATEPLRARLESLEQRHTIASAELRSLLDRIRRTLESAVDGT